MTMPRTNSPAKTATIRARIDPALKAKAEAILEEIGMSPSSVIRLLYQAVIRDKGLPLDLHIPTGKPSKPEEGTRYANVDEMFKALGVKRGKTR
jgi:DNA-damage-inducible protein J